MDDDEIKELRSKIESAIILLKDIGEAVKNTPLLYTQMIIAHLSLGLVASIFSEGEIDGR